MKKPAYYTVAARQVHDGVEYGGQFMVGYTLLEESWLPNEAIFLFHIEKLTEAMDEHAPMGLDREWLCRPVHIE